MTLVRKYWGADRAYHHTAPINNIYGLHESLRIVLEEGSRRGGSATRRPTSGSRRALRRSASTSR
jgi:aspartate aminotransferase-like enzyme